MTSIDPRLTAALLGQPLQDSEQVSELSCTQGNDGIT
jgi:hypothetical protein